jgi:hypothetical protein
LHDGLHIVVTLGKHGGITTNNYLLARPSKVPDNYNISLNLLLLELTMRWILWPIGIALLFAIGNMKTVMILYPLAVLVFLFWAFIGALIGVR